MASFVFGFARRLVLLLVASLLAIHTQPAWSIQVSPNSPCASLCIDKSTLDASDPNSSNTYGADLSCEDADFANTEAGQKWVSCMECLQNSTFSQGTESDQGWFFYNLRYNVDFCVFGYPNASGAASSPCQTVTACGALQLSLFDGIPSMGNKSEFDYCAVNNSAMTSSSYGSCLDCIDASGDTNIVANSLIALEAGCLQKPSPDEAVGLSGSLFSATTVHIVSPTAKTGAPASGGTRHVTLTAIVVIVVAVVLLFAAVAGFVFVCYRKHTMHRRQAAIDARSTGARRANDGNNGNGRGDSTGPTNWKCDYTSAGYITSPLSFQCRANRTSAASVEKVATATETEKTGAAAYDRRISSMLSRRNGDSTSTSNSLSLTDQPQQQQQQIYQGLARKNRKDQLPHNHSNANVQQMPAIVESPLPPSTSSVSLPAVSSPTGTGPIANEAPQQLHQLRTSFARSSSAPYHYSTTTIVSRGSPVYSTPTSATALLALSPAAATPDLSHPISAPSLRLQTPPTTEHAPYNPANYPAPRGRSLSAQQQNRSGCYDPLSAASTTSQSAALLCGGSSRAATMSPRADVNNNRVGDIPGATESPGPCSVSLTCAATLTATQQQQQQQQEPASGIFKLGLATVAAPPRALDTKNEEAGVRLPRRKATNACGGSAGVSNGSVSAMSVLQPDTALRDANDSHRLLLGLAIVGCSMHAPPPIQTQRMGQFQENKAISTSSQAGTGDRSSPSGTLSIQAEFLPPPPPPRRW